MRVYRWIPFRAVANAGPIANRKIERLQSRQVQSRSTSSRCPLCRQKATPQYRGSRYNSYNVTHPTYCCGGSTPWPGPYLRQHKINYALFGKDHSGILIEFRLERDRRDGSGGASTELLAEQGSLAQKSTIQRKFSSVTKR
jgi:hypothetical protein